MNEHRILMLMQRGATFCENDLKILSRHFRVRSIEYTWNDPLEVLLLAVRSLFGVAWCDISYAWFGSINAFFSVLYSKLFRKRSVVVAGGYDAASSSEIGYGLLNTRMRPFSLFAFRFCDRVLAVSEFTKDELIRNAGIDENKIDVIHNGVSVEDFSPGRESKERLVISVGGINRMNLRKKGIELFIRSAKYLPDTSFVMVGKFIDDSIEKLREIAPSNVTFTGFLSSEELVRYYQRAKVYVQASIHESFGVSVAEAMLCECVPVITRRAALPEVVGDSGYYVDEENPEDVARAIELALVDERKGTEARQRVIDMFSLEKREQELVRILEEMMQLKQDNQIH